MNSLNYKGFVYTNFKLLSNLHVEESAYISSNVDIFGVLTVSNDAHITGQLDVSNNVTFSSNLTVLQGISGDGSNLTNLHADNINQGTLLVPYGGTGRNSFTANKLLSGNSTSALQEVADLHWDSTNAYLGIGTSTPSSTLDVTGNFHLTQGAVIDGQLQCLNGFSGDGSNLSNLDMDNAALGTLIVGRGGTGKTTLGASKVLLGNGTSAIQDEVDLHFDTTNKRLGIKNNSPSSTLDVNGDMYVSAATQMVGKVTMDSNLEVLGNTRVHGDLTVDGTKTTMNTDVKVTDQFVIVNDGTGPALEVNQVGDMPIAHFKDDSNIVMTIADNGLVGIGVENPTEKLHVVGNALIDSNVRAKGDLEVDGMTTLKGTLDVQSAATLSNALTVEGSTTLNNTLNVTNAADFGSTLDVSGSAGFSNTLTVSGATTLNSTLNVTSDTTLESHLTVLNGMTGNGSNITNLDVNNVALGVLDVQYGGTGQNALTANKLLVGNGSSAVNAEADLHFDTTNTRLGIAQSTPGHTLDVNGNMRVVNGAQFESAVAMSNILTVAQNATVEGALSVLAGISGDGSNITNLDVNNVSLGTLNVNHGGTGKTALTASKVLLGNGTSGIQDEPDLHFDTTNKRLGINTATPSHTLDVNGVFHTTSNALFDTDINVSGSVILSDGTALVSSNDLRPSELLQNNLNIGIGTANPNYKLDVNGDMRVTADATFQSQVIVQNGISGDGSNVTNLDVNNVALGVLDVQYGGTGQNSLTTNKLLVGAGTSGVNAETNLHYDTTNAYLGIGMTNPSYTVDINGNFHATGAATFDSNVNVSGSMTVSTGISGDGSNITNLDVNNVALGVLDVQYGGTGNNSLTSEKVLLGNGQNGINAEGDLHFDVAQSRLGINTTTPGYSLDVSGDARVTGAVLFNSNLTVDESIILTTDGYTITTQNDLRPSQIVQENNMIGISQTNPQYDLDVGGTFHVSSNSVLDGSLNVGTGITGDGSNITNLDVDNVALGVLDVQYGGTGNSNLTVDHVLIGNGTNKLVDNANLFFDTTNDRLAVGHTSPGYTLDVNGTIYASSNFYWSGSRLGIGTITPQYELDVQGTIYASEDVQYASDRRIKTDIQPIDNVMDRMAGVRGHKFKRTDLGEDKKDAFHIGFIAQELQDVVPECVGYSKDIDQYHVSYGNMVALLAEAFHNVHDRLVRLEKECGKN